MYETSACTYWIPLLNCGYIKGSYSSSSFLLMNDTSFCSFEKHRNVCEFYGPGSFGGEREINYISWPYDY